MLELSQFHLEFSLPGAGALSEDIQDQRGAIQNLAVENLLQIPALSGREFFIKDDRVHLPFLAFSGKRLGLARPDEGGRHGRFQLLNSLSDHEATRRRR